MDDGAGNIATDSRSGVTYAYGYNNANRLKTVTVGPDLLGTYTPAFAGAGCTTGSNS